MRQDLAHQARVIPDLVAGDLALAWDPGTGKTRPCLRAGGILGGPQLVIAPAHLRGTWAEAVGLDVPNRSVRVIEGVKAKFSAETDITVVSYEFAKALPRWKELRQQWFSSVVLDEAQYLARGEAARTRAILGSDPNEKYGLIFRSKNVWPISGTFIGGYPDEIYPLLRFLFPGAVKSFRPGIRYMDLGEFIGTFCVTAQTGFGTKIIDGKNYDMLRERMDPYFDRVRLEDVVDMPPLVIDTIPVFNTLKNLARGLDPAQIAEFKALELILDDPSISDEAALQALYDAEIVVAEMRHALAMLKVDAAEQIIRDELTSGVDRILCFGWHKEPLRELARRFNGSGLITGGMSDAARDRELEWFKRGGHVLFGQILAMGSGLNIQHCCRTLFLEASWSTRDNRQAIHRTYRNGQTRPCHISFLSLVRSIDERVAKLLARKAKIVKRALD